MYTTSLATISTPRPGIRVASRKKPPFNQQTFQLSITETRSEGGLHLPVIPTRPNLSTSVTMACPAATSTPQGSFRGKGEESASVFYHESSSEYFYEEDFRATLEVIFPF